MRNCKKTFEMGRWVTICGLAILGWLLTGCATSAPSGQPEFAEFAGATATAPPAASAQPSTQATAATGTNSIKSVLGDPYAGTDILRVGESIEVNFSDLPFIQPPFKERIKEDGSITLLQNQPFQAAGKRRGELEKEIRARYVPRFFLNLTVTITPLDRFFYVGGEVKAPQRHVYTGPITVMRAIQSSGDFTDFAKKTEVQLIRADGKTFEINAKKALKDPRLDLEVVPGDRIHVPRRIW